MLSPGMAPCSMNVNIMTELPSLRREPALRQWASKASGRLGSESVVLTPAGGSIDCRYAAPRRSTCAGPRGHSPIP